MGAFSMGIILSFLALGVYISFRIFNFPDITADGSFAAGGAVAAILIASGINPVIATLAGTLAGMIAGTMTGIIHTKFKIHGLLSGILVMTAFYSINLHIMGKSNVPLISSRTLTTYTDEAASFLFMGRETVEIFGRECYTGDIGTLAAGILLITLAAMLLYWYFRTNLGSAMRATGDNPQMILSLGVNTGNMIIIGLAISNGLIGLSGALLAQYQGFADVQMGIGMVVWGLASVIIGEALTGQNSGLGFTITGAIMGSVLFRLLVALALRWGLNPNDLKLITAAFVLIALVSPELIKKIKKKNASISFYRT